MGYRNKEDERAYQQRYYQTHKAKVKARSAARYSLHKEEINANGRAYRKSTHGKATMLAKKFGVTYETALELLSITQCQICGRTETLATDHDHKTGRVRGRLCYRCNRALGAFDDSILMLSRAVAYLEQDDRPRPMPGTKDCVCESCKHLDLRCDQEPCVSCVNSIGPDGWEPR